MATVREIREGLEILAKYLPNENVQFGGAEHDILFAVDESINVSSEDAVLLEALGWFVDDSCWAHFV